MKIGSWICSMTHNEGVGYAKLNITHFKVQTFKRRQRLDSVPLKQKGLQRCLAVAAPCGVEIIMNVSGFAKVVVACIGDYAPPPTKGPL